MTELLVNFKNDKTLLVRRNSGQTNDNTLNTNGRVGVGSTSDVIIESPTSQLNPLHDSNDYLTPREATQILKREISKVYKIMILALIILGIAAYCSAGALGPLIHDLHDFHTLIFDRNTLQRNYPKTAQQVNLFENVLQKSHQSLIVCVCIFYYYFFI